MKKALLLTVGLGLLSSLETSADSGVPVKLDKVMKRMGELKTVFSIAGKHKTFQFIKGLTDFTALGVTKPTSFTNLDAHDLGRITCVKIDGANKMYDAHHKPNLNGKMASYQTANGKNLAELIASKLDNESNKSIEWHKKTKSGLKQEMHSVAWSYKRLGIKGRGYCAISFSVR